MARPYLADNPNTSVRHTIGTEDQFRIGPFIATFSFWLLVSLVALRLPPKLVSMRKLRYREDGARLSDLDA